MKLSSVVHDAQAGWRGALPAELDSERTLVLAFGAPSYEQRPEVFAELRAALPRATLIGCSTAGEILGDRISDETLVVMVARFQSTSLCMSWMPVESSVDSYAAGTALVLSLTTRENPRAIFVLSDGTRVNGSELIRGMNSVAHEGIVITGGLAGDGARFGHTWVVGQEGPRSGWVAAVGLYGERLRIGHGSKGGWDIFGVERRVTRSAGNVLYDLDGKPALELYKRYLGERAAGLPATALLFPLSLRADTHTQERLVRTILGIDEATQSMTFAGDVPKGSLVQLMRANSERLIEGAAGAALATRGSAVQDGSTLCIAVSCVGRRLVLGERTEEEVESALEVMPAATQLVGFYSYGEISPFTSGRCELHNQTMTLTSFQEF
jgi:hypothetical protein